MKKLLTLLAVLAFGFGAIFYLSRTLEICQPKPDERLADEDLYVSARGLKLFGSDFRGLLADWYWIKSLQYLGSKVVNHQQQLNLNDLRPLNPRLVYPMLDAAATLDPQFTTLYSYGAAILPAIDVGQAIKLLEKGITENPDNWRLYHNLGYIHWQAKNYPTAAAIYAEGAGKPGAPVFMRQMSVNMQAEGGSREFALRVYKQMYDTAQDEQSKTFAEFRFRQTESQIERDAIRSVLQNFQKQNGRCINSWSEIFNSLRAVKLPPGRPLNFDKNNSPVDSTGVPYALVTDSQRCEVGLGKNSTIVN